MPGNPAKAHYLKVGKRCEIIDMPGEPGGAEFWTDHTQEAIPAKIEPFDVTFRH
jgi:hypothetical protein